MLKYKKYILLMCSFLIFKVSGAQINVPVDLNTGKPAISIPLYTVQFGAMSLPLSLNYKSGGITVDADEGVNRIGLGWELSAGGSVSRVVKGLPDDDAKGWLHSYGASQSKLISVSAGLDCSSGNITTLPAWVTNQIDLEPDVFNFSFEGYSGQFVFDNEGGVQAIPYQGLKINPHYDSGGKITSIGIKTSNGSSYSFSATKVITEKITPEIPPGRTADDIYYLKINPELYKNGISRTYTTEWKLTSIYSSSGGYIWIDYGNSYGENGSFEKISSAAIPVNIFLKNSSYVIGGDEPEFKKYTLYKREITTTTKILKRVAASTRVFHIEVLTKNKPEYPISPNGVPVTRQPAIIGLDVLINGQLEKSISFERKSINKRIYLYSVRETNDCDEAPPYKFEYYGVSGYEALLPDPLLESKEQDFWGYFNANKATELLPNLNIYPEAPEAEKYRLETLPYYTGTRIYLGGGFNRTVNSAVVAAGSLNRIIYPTGGNLKIDYEPNIYYDAFADESYKGGGIRVKKLTIHDGISTANDIVKEYTYSGGRLLNRPRFYFPLNVYKEPGKDVIYSNPGSINNPYSYFTARTETDLSSYTFDQPDVLYEYAEEKLAGKGKTSYEFAVPAMYGDLSSSEYSSPNHWEATSTGLVMAPVNSVCGPVGNLSTGPYAYPYPSNTNYGFERGVLKNIKYYNESGQLLKENSYQYQPVYEGISPKLVYGLALDFFKGSGSTIYTAAKYKLLTGMSKLKSNETEIIYDPAVLTRKATTSTNYYFSGTQHNIMSSKSSSVAHDGNIGTTYTTKYKYPQDYVIDPLSTDTFTLAIKKLQDKNITNLAVEEISCIKHANGEEKVVGAVLKKFKLFPHDRVLPVQVLQLNTNVPLSDFMISDIYNGVFTADSRYKLVTEVNDYNEFGAPASKRSNNNLEGIHYSLGGALPVASIKNALADQVVYSSFNDEQSTTFPHEPYPSNFEKGTNDYGEYSYVEGRLDKAKFAYPNHVFRKYGLKKGPGSNYIFSCWIKSSHSGTITITLSDANGHSSIKSIGFDNKPDEWVYYETAIATSMMDHVFDVAIQADSPFTVDDMLFYPAMAQVNLFSYNKMNKIAETDTKGNTTFYEYNGLGKLVLVRDKNQNILERYIYNYQDKIELRPIIMAEPSRDATINIPVTFEDLTNRCDNLIVTRTWDFGDGSTYTSTGNTAENTYSTPGNYMVSLTVSHPDYGTATDQYQLAVVNPTPNLSVNYKGYHYYDLCYQTGFSDDYTNSYPPGLNIFEAMVYQHPCSSGYTYKWEKRSLSPWAGWTLLPQTTSTITIDVRDQYGQVSALDSYQVRCTVTPNCSNTLPVVRESIEIKYVVNVNCN